MIMAKQKKFKSILGSLLLGIMQGAFIGFFLGVAMSFLTGVVFLKEIFITLLIVFTIFGAIFGLLLKLWRYGDSSQE